MISDIAHHLKELWIFDYQDLRPIDDGIFAINLVSGKHETKVDFLDRIGAVVNTIDKKFRTDSVSIDFTKPMFAIIEFEVKQ